jgi:class 3 adenylate cyclase
VGEILVSETALARMDIDVAGLEARRLELKGIRQPVSVRTLHAA